MGVKDRKCAFGYDLKNDRLVSKGGILVEGVGEKLGLSKKETFSELKRREKMFSKLDSEFFGCYKNIQKGLFDVS
jgi:hypothetical protein